MDKLDDKQLNYYFMATVEIAFADSAGETAVTKANSLIKSEDGNVPARLLAKAQNSAFAQLMAKVNDANLILLNATFVCISPLGHMTEAEMHKLPDMSSAVKVQ